MTHVLVVDDGKVLGHLLKAAFATLDAAIQVFVVPSILEAESALENEKFDLMVLDILPPGKPALEFAKKSRKAYPDMKMIQTSGMNDPNFQDKAITSGADAFFAKPIEMGEFLELASTYLGLKRVVRTGKVTSELKPRPAPDLLVDTLAGLRQELSAVEVVLMDNKGQTLAKAGEFSDESVLTAIVPPLLSASNAALKISSILSTDEPENVLACRGRDYDLVICPVESEFLLMVVLQHTASRVKTAIAFEAISVVQHDLHTKLTTLGLLEAPGLSESHLEAEEITEETPAEIQPAESNPGETPAVEASDTLLEDTLKKAAKKKLAPVEVDTFWDSAVTEVSAIPPTTPDLLTYEQADRLGLTPKDPRKEAE
jgi:CheY-like chemotaxis protein